MGTPASYFFLQQFTGGELLAGRAMDHADSIYECGQQGRIEL